MRLIDADALKKAIIKHLCVKSENNLFPAEKSIYNCIDEQPTVEPLKEQQAGIEQLKGEGKPPTWRKGKAFCGNCGGCLENKEMFSSYHVSSIRFCKWCGVSVDWSNGQRSVKQDADRN